MNPLLILVYFFHYVVVSFFALYLFFRKDNTYDMLYMLFIVFKVIGWTTGECILTYFENIIKDKNYKYGTNSSYPNSIILIGTTTMLIEIFTMYALMTLNNVPTSIKFFVLYFMIYYPVHFRLYDKENPDNFSITLTNTFVTAALTLISSLIYPSIRLK